MHMKQVYKLWKMKVTSSSGVFSTSITMEVIYCYLEKKTKKF